jgi:hypothetical protein
MGFVTFVLGAIMMTVGFLAVVRTEAFLRYFGDVSNVFGLVGAQWLSWKVLGILLLLFGFLIAFGIFGALFHLTIGQLFNIGEL